MTKIEKKHRLTARELSQILLSEDFYSVAQLVKLLPTKFSDSYATKRDIMKS